MTARPLAVLSQNIWSFKWKDNVIWKRRRVLFRRSSGWKLSCRRFYRHFNQLYVYVATIQCNNPLESTGYCVRGWVSVFNFGYYFTFAFILRNSFLPGCGRTNDQTCRNESWAIVKLPLCRPSFFFVSYVSCQLSSMSSRYFLFLVNSWL